MFPGKHSEKIFNRLDRILDRSVEKLCCSVTNIFHWIKNHHFQKPLGNFLHVEMRNGWSTNICSSVQLVQSIFLFRMTRMWMEWLIFFANRLFFPFFDRDVNTAVKVELLLAAASRGVQWTITSCAQGTLVHSSKMTRGYTVLSILSEQTRRLVWGHYR